MTTVIKAENLTKKYRLGLIGSSTLRDDLQNAWVRFRGREDMLGKVGETTAKTPSMDAGSNGGQKKAEIIRAAPKDVLWALRDVSFEVKQGEILGIIGRNGAGKSTLLKILSRVTAPTSGYVKVKGRIASLLEVGTGFHPELTGRENIFLNGAILGMTKAEITRKFDEIVAFSEVEKFIDTPVKRYSSGMYVRLAFAVAAHLEPEILIVDEVLAVGDDNFQRKCLGKMRDVSANEGRTVLFVSHNMSSVQKLCSRAAMMDGGQIRLYGNTTEVVEQYLSRLRHDTSNGVYESAFAQLSVNMLSKSGETRNLFHVGEPVTFKLRLKLERPIRNAAIGIGIETLTGDRVLTHHTMYQLPGRLDLEREAVLTLNWPECNLNVGHYNMVSALYEDGKILADWPTVGEISINESDYFLTGKLPDPRWQGRVLSKASWTNANHAD